MPSSTRRVCVCVQNLQGELEQLRAGSLAMVVVLTSPSAQRYWTLVVGCEE